MHQLSSQSQSSWIESLKLALDLISDPVFLIDPHSFQIVTTNQAAACELGYLSGGLPSRQWGELAIDWDRASQMELAHQEEAAPPFPIKLHRKDGSIATFEASVRITENNKEQVLVIVCKQIQQAVHLEHDWLTGIASRSSLEQQLNQTLSLAAHTKKACAVFFIDLDRFKQINDTWGHRIGDMVLRNVARRLNCLIRPSDVIARYGGDEFVLVFKEISQAQEIQTIADRIRSAFHESITFQDQEIQIAASIGIAISTGSESAEELIDKADRAMYLAKPNSKHRIHFPPIEANKTLAKI